MSLLVYAPGERYVLAHRLPAPPASVEHNTGYGLAVGDGWQTLPAELTTPICAGCTAALRSPSREDTPAPQPAQAPATPSPSTEASSAAPEPPQPAPDPVPEEPPPATAEAPPLPQAPNGVPLAWRVLAWLRTLCP
ncbi:hypothetical protein ACQEVF_25160 [Nonomuraea polychroma]|uniref:hypothetical protein n=1 Tax=Nonomuraea polychroma TaxID=46176 RepID=UPI003D92E6CD